MQITGLVSALSLVSAAVAVPHTHEHTLAKRQVPWRPCAHQTGGVHIIGISGEGHANPPYGLIGSLTQKVMQAIPGSTNISMPYDHDQTNGMVQTRDGTNTLNTWIQQYHDTCPHTKIVLLGYSSGAIMTLNSLCGEPVGYGANRATHLKGGIYGPSVVAAIAYGDETYTPYQTYNAGTCTGHGLHPRSSPEAQCGYGWNERIQSFCDSDDPMCCVETGTSKANHYTYPAKYDDRARDFVVSQVMKFGGA